ncbi:MAG: pyridoxine 5'-phosphate synthase [Bacteroidales bacterium]|nr:pyridoxine 5'-phosphate synthase [Bacteroidales bacterium]MCB9028716.1 pyridoxine 5'-phosphate synthase [Bacteroidales bacterium]NLD63172.1 pyridoxine 5'-phosphate synthase [Bacteroidales bacterium]HNT93879.1 pyridoxine 5'-phosphate synthase [Bacteroidales bacterium]HOO66824.1 pyridoxine 5'-phosphate synthase [Bacteroidales bacterium]
MTRLSVNINKIATLRNARGGNVPDVKMAAVRCQGFGAEGITVHPRPDERHIRYSDVYDIRDIVTTEFNIEGNPEEQFIKLVLDVVPDQVTLVPDAHDAITSNSGWDTITNLAFLTEVVARFHERGIRTSIFTGTDPEMIEYAARTGTDRIELYTEPYASMYPSDRVSAVAPFVKAAEVARKAGLGINAGHDLDLNNLAWLHSHIPWLEEVSIGHALVSDALYYGLENTIQMYLRELRRS